MRFIALLVFVVTTSAFADTVSRDVKFSHPTRTIWGETFYNCNAVEDMLESHLRKLGASSIRVRCTGGLETWGGQWRGFPLNVRATFEAPVPTTDVVRSLRLASRAGDSSCELHVAMLNKVLPLFPAVEVVSKNDRCSSNSSRWSFDLKVRD
jgi:hypothetical protein